MNMKKLWILFLALALVVGVVLPTGATDVYAAEGSNIVATVTVQDGEYREFDSIEKGWVYDETLPSQEFFFLALEGAFARHPKLRAAVAHMGFYSDNLDRASALLDLYPNLYFDITPALIIYSQLSETPEKSKAFFNKYSDRLIYGTDADNDLTGHAREYNDTKTEVIKWFLEGNEPKNVCGYDITPVCLNAEKLADIYYNNAMRFMGKSH